MHGKLSAAFAPAASTARCALVPSHMAPGSPSRPPGSPSRPDLPYPSRYARRPSAAQLEETIAEQTGPASAAAGKAAGFYVVMLIWVALSMGYNKITKRQ